MVRNVQEFEPARLAEETRVGERRSLHFGRDEVVVVVLIAAGVGVQVWVGGRSCGGGG
jgi:hypothetical protein